MKAWEQYPKLASAVKQSHSQIKGVSYGHGMSHVLVVAGLCELIAPDEETARLAGVAALCHNADRILQKQHNLGRYGIVPMAEIDLLVHQWLGTEPNDAFSITDKSAIHEAVHEHANKNNPDHSIVTQVLMDADRLSIMSLESLARTGQFWGDDIESIDLVHLLDDPEANWRNPKTLFRVTKEFLDWMKFDGPVGIRLPKARVIAKRRAEKLVSFQNDVIEDIEESGVLGVSIT